MIPNKLIMKATPMLTGATSIYPFDAELAARFTVASRFGEKVELWSRTADGRIRLPRGCCPISSNDQRLDGCDAERFQRLLEPRNDEQERCIAENIDLLQAGASFIFEAPTGFGKTCVACDVIGALGRKTLVVVTKDDLVKQWKEKAMEFLGLPSNAIGYIKQDRYDVAGKDLVIGMVHSLAIEDRYPASIRKEFGLVVFDEVHRLGAETFSRVASMFPARLRWGLSATPERADGKEVVFFAHIGPVRVRAERIPMKPKVLRYLSTWECPRVYRTDPQSGTVKKVKLPHSPGKIGGVIKSLIADPHRNALLCEMLLLAWEKKRKTVFFADHKDHLDTLYGLAIAAGVPAGDMAFYVSETKGAAREAAKVAPIMLATYQMMGEGTDIPWLDCIIMGTPRSEVKQIVGRILREYPEKRQPIVFDLVDADSGVLRGYAKKRALFYRSVGGEMLQMQQS